MTELALAVLLAAATIPWTRDYTAAMGEGEERKRPLLLYFRGECGGGNRPQNPIELGGPIVHQEGLSECDRMEDDVWEHPAVVAAVSRFVPVIVDGGDRTLHVRYQAVRMPTTLVADPWGNEVLRVSGYFERAKVLRLLEAVPADFSGLAEAAKALRARPEDFAALVSAAAFYEEQRLPQVVERLYAAALGRPRSAVPVEAWRRAVISRGMNFLVGLGDAAAAAAVFETEAAAAPDAPGSDAVLLGLVNARLQQGKRKEAETVVRDLEKRFAGSPYAQRARQNLEATRK